MRVIFLLLLLGLISLPSASAGGDSIELKDGTVISGSIVAAGEGIDLSPKRVLFNSQQVYIDTEEGLKKIDISEIKTIHFAPRVMPKSQPDASPQNA